MANRVLIIGLDGASPHLIQQWRADLPHLAALMERGASGTLQSVYPPRSIPAWYCFATGMNPAKLDVFGFSQRRPGSYDYTFANFTHCQAPPFWEWLDDAKKPSGIIHLPGTFPPRPLSGFMVSGWPGPLNRGNLTYSHPPELSREIDDWLKRPFELVSPLPIQKDNDAAMVEERHRILQMHGDVAYRLLQKRPWRLGVVVLSPIDRASHQFWRHMAPHHPQHDPTLVPQFGDALRQMYRASDAQVGRLLSLTDEDDWVFIVSDHGFGPVRRTFYLNEWLRREGYLVLKDNGKSTAAGGARRLLGKLAAPLFRLNQTSPLFRRLAEPFKKRALSNQLREAYVRQKAAGLVRLNFLPVDWSKTTAYCPDESSLYLNLSGRDPEGMIQPGEEAERVLSELIQKLSQLSDPETGEPINVHLKRKEAVYNGRFLPHAPELIVDMDNYQTEVMAELQPGLLLDNDPLRSGNHTLEGTLIAAGPGILAKQSVDAGLMDIAPTALHLLETAVPEAMDGRVLLEMFAPDSAVGQREVMVGKTAEFDSATAQSFTAEEQAQIEKQLRDLGYLS